ncbi:MAG: NADH-quinone oxidoreductase subunit NuoF [Actinobacteria bacterium]|nr:NADH-quinone oxidoreductase subunit NuoF [Actinomycetota bacterium]MBM3713030.1 NADH-quinone oxidoreductase subunit NuoF [Actinomycetota bacterium]
MNKQKSKINSLEELENRAILLQEELSGKTIISICSGTGCKAYASEEVYDALIKEINSISKNYPEKIKNILVKRTGCHGYCERGPIMVIHPEEICYTGVKKEDVPEIVEKTITGDVVEKFVYRDESGNPVVKESDIPFYKFQKRVILDSNSKIDPASIDDYIRIGGYQALAKCLTEMSPDEVLKEVKDANLRGRGGGGFPAGIKWETVKNVAGKPKYVVVNADEGDPGAYMDRSILEGNPHSVLEGLIIAAYAIGASEGFIYVRQEYPQAVQNIINAIEQARELGLLGENILNSKLNFDVKVHRGAGAFVSGESSALMTAIEGSVGEPRLKYIHTAVSGLWGKPTNLNNVETYANIPKIVKNGAEWFKSIGTKGSSGTKIFSLVGKVNNTGLIEVPMGITLRDIIYKIGGGIKNGKKFKSVQTGGPSGGVIPEQLLDLPVDFDELNKAGSMMGSGGMIVMDESDCMVNIAHYFLNFLADESCGKCVPCREGLRQMIYIYERIMNGNGRVEDLKMLEDLSVLLEGASLCALGSTAQNIVVTTLKYFREEYEAHIYYNSCPAMVCKPLIHYRILEDKCSGCRLCVKSCPVNAISGEPKKPHAIEQDLCIKCGACMDVCPEKFNAVVKRTGVLEKVPLAEKISEKVV